MKRSRWMRRGALVGLVLAAALATVLLVSDSRLSVASEVDINCVELCEAVVTVPGVGTYEGSFNGSLTASTGTVTAGKDGRRVTPFRILGSAMRGQVEGLGETMMWFDKTRPVSGSALREKRAGTRFPATQEMRSHLLMTIEAFPGRTFRTINPFVVRSNNVNALPPHGAVFQLAGPVNLEDVDQPGEVAVTLLEGRAVINPPAGGGIHRIDRTSPGAEEPGR